MNPRVVPHLTVEWLDDDEFDTSPYEDIAEAHECGRYQCRHFKFDAEGTPFEVIVRYGDVAQLELRRGHSGFDECHYVEDWSEVRNELDTELAAKFMPEQPSFHSSNFPSPSEFDLLGFVANEFW